MIGQRCSHLERRLGALLRRTHPPLHLPLTNEKDRPMRSWLLLSVAVLSVVLGLACNEVDGQCWSNTSAGGGVSTVPIGTGDSPTGDSPGGTGRAPPLQALTAGDPLGGGCNPTPTCTEMFTACQDKGLPCTKQIEPKKTLCAFCLEDCNAKRSYRYSQCYSCGFE
jgi:hypothetical protein